ncbi:MAG: hypothetical protein GC164_14275 [Phycisphaera sp.]|nr:hypothetical protein [Phycisphaera sp.]
MKKFLPILVVCVLSAIWPIAVAQTTKSHDNSGLNTKPRIDDYRVVWQHSVFSSSRRTVRSTTTTPTQTRPTEPPAPHDEGSDWVLRGTMFRGDKWVALFENLRTGETKTLDVGQSLASRTVKVISIDGVALENGSDINVGRSLTGELAVTTSYALSGMSSSGDSSHGSASTNDSSNGSASPSSNTSGGSASGGSASGGSILEQLRQRRAQETGGPR